MIRTLLSSAIAVALLAYASVTLAADPIHTTTLENFPAARQMKWENSFTDNHGKVSHVSYNVCLQGPVSFSAAKGSTTGTSHIIWSVQTADGTFETIKEYDVILVGPHDKALRAEPAFVDIDMSAYGDAYPTCQYIPLPTLTIHE